MKEPKKSIITHNWNVCYYCKQYPRGSDILSRHEMIPGNTRQQCIDDGLVIPLHVLTCHPLVQHNAQLQNLYEQEAQAAWMEHYRVEGEDPRERFFRRYGKSYDGVEFVAPTNLMKLRME